MEGEKPRSEMEQIEPKFLPSGHSPAQWNLAVTAKPRPRLHSGSKDTDADMSFVERRGYWFSVHCIIGRGNSLF